MAEARAEGSTGRPRITVDKEQIEILRSLRITWEEISLMMGVSVKTLQRRARDYNIKRFSAITDRELDIITGNCLEDFPNAGQVMLQGHMISLELRIPRERLRQSLQRVGLRNSLTPVITRRTYSVSGPNALWHLDGNHKMIRWRLVIHAGIDGHSRLITYIHCSDNNRAETVMELFLYGTHQFGIPSHVRSDKGGENVRVWVFMEQVRGYNRGSYITGSSVHNTRIERLWRDVCEAFTTTYIAIFTELEDQGVLDPLNDTDLFCLHYVFLPRINASLHSFQQAWNNHPLSTENCRSPLEIYMIDSLENGLFHDSLSMNLLQDEDHSDDGCEYSESDVIAIPEITSPLNENTLNYLRATVDPLQISSNHGIDLYRHCVHVVCQLIRNQHGV